MTGAATPSMPAPRRTNGAQSRSPRVEVSGPKLLADTAAEGQASGGTTPRRDGTTSPNTRPWTGGCYSLSGIGGAALRDG